MCTGYILQWLDTLVTVTLNPSKSRIVAITKEEIEKVHAQLLLEKDKIETAIKVTVFSIDDEDKTKCMIKKYHASLVSLLDQVLKYQAQASADSSLKPLYEIIVANIDELLALIESRFTSYLSLEERVPSTYLELAKKELLKKISSLSNKVGAYQSYQSGFDIIKNELTLFLKNPVDKQFYTFRQLFYIKELCRELEQLRPEADSGIYTALDDLLISMNFNAKPYIYNITQRIAVHNNSSEQPGERMEGLLFDLKSFNQLHRRPDIVFNTKEAGLHAQINNWFSQEIYYLEKKAQYLVHPLTSNTTEKKAKTEIKQKIQSMLSVDQLALILRAADDTKIIIARSLNTVFKVITPYLSTAQQENLSYNSMRGKSYSAETRDKQIAIDALKQIIDRIKEL